MRAIALCFLTLFSLGSSLSSASSRDEALSEDQKVLHLLSRITFGARPGDLERVKAMGWRTFLEEQLEPSGRDPSGVAARLANLKTLKMTPKELVDTFSPPRFDRRLREKRRSEDEKVREEARMEMADMRRRQRQIQLELTQAKLIRAVHSQHQLFEMMVDFWMNHFNVFMPKQWDRFLTTQFEEEVVRPNALGRFEDLLVSVARSPAMLYYLDNWLSSAPEAVIRQRMKEKAPRHRAGRRRSMNREDRHRMMAGIFGPTPALFRAKGLNENYARELLELHAVGVDAPYTQEDVIQVAKYFTGWTLTALQMGAEFTFQPLMHESGDKIVLGHSVRSAGVEEGERVLKILAHHPETARFLATKLVRRFVADDPPRDLVEVAARTFEQTGGDIQQVLKSIFTSPRFYDPLFFQAKAKKPFELVVSSLRAVGADFSEPRPLFHMLAQMGEAPYRCLTPNGYPDRASAWINTNTLLKRLNFALALASGRIPGVRVNLEPAQSLFQELNLPEVNLEQAESIGRLLGDDRRALGQVANRRVVVESAFKLGSPQFQKR